MNFAQLFSKSNSSMHQLQGNILESIIESRKPGNNIIVNTGLRSPAVFSAPGVEVTSDSSLLPLGSFFGGGNTNFFETLGDSKFQLLRSCLIGLEDKRSTLSGDYVYISPRSLEKISNRKLVWAELTKLWRAGKEKRVKGFILNSVNGGYAVALAGYIAFLPKSLCCSKKVFLGQWRKFFILAMNSKIANIMVTEKKANFISIRSPDRFEERCDATTVAKPTLSAKRYKQP